MASDEEMTLKKRFDKLDHKRDIPLNRGRRAAAVTIPTVLPPEGHSSVEDLPTPFQSNGAEAVNSLASKLLLTLFPPNAPFYKLKLASDDLATLLSNLQGKEKAQTEAMIQTALVDSETKIQSKIEQEGYRVALHKVLKDLIVVGNSCMFVPDEGPAQVFRFDNWVVKRDPSGNIMELITREFLDRTMLDEDIQILLANFEKPSDDQPEFSTDPDEDTVTLYTQVRRVSKDQFEVVQEANEVRLPEEKTFKATALPWIVPRWNSLHNEDYGRGMVEEYIGTVSSLEGISEGILDFVAAAVKVLGFVNPNGVTFLEDVLEAENLDFVSGVGDDVTFLSVEKLQDLRAVLERADKLERQISRVFLMASSVQRDAERVTAEEIRIMANELETALGGAFSTMSIELQRPMVNRLISLLRQQNKIIKVKEKNLKFSIVTGLEGLGRNQELNKVVTFVRELTALFGPEIVASRARVDQIMTIAANALGLDPSMVVKSAEEVAAEARAQLEQQATLQAARPVAENATKFALGQNQGE